MSKRNADEKDSFFEPLTENDKKYLSWYHSLEGHREHNVNNMREFMAGRVHQIERVQIKANDPDLYSIFNTMQTRFIGNDWLSKRGPNSSNKSRAVIQDEDMPNIDEAGTQENSTDSDDVSDLASISPQGSDSDEDMESESRVDDKHNYSIADWDAFVRDKHRTPVMQRTVEHETRTIAEWDAAMREKAEERTATHAKKKKARRGNHHVAAGRVFNQNTSNVDGAVNHVLRENPPQIDVRE
jgi:hypothetical protein